MSKRKTGTEHVDVCALIDAVEAERERRGIDTHEVSRVIARSRGYWDAIVANPGERPLPPLVALRLCDAFGLDPDRYITPSVVKDMRTTWADSPSGRATVLRGTAASIASLLARMPDSVHLTVTVEEDR